MCFNGTKPGKGRLVKACYHGSWTRPSEKADSELNGHTASEVECNQERLHTPALPDHTAAALRDTREAHTLKNGVFSMAQSGH